MEDFIFGMGDKKGVPCALHCRDIISAEAWKGIDFPSHREDFVGIILMCLCVYDEIELNLFPVHIAIKIHYHGLRATAIETT